ncbi:MAG TPA: RluA family pseudouridine synthase [Bacilli bacterium]|nr:RluA family pseudouridine synthase [Bacilli bacterium]
MTNFIHHVTEVEANTRVDQLLTQLVEGVSRAQIQTWIKSGLVMVNGKQVKANYRVQEKDQLGWNEPEKESIKIEPEAIPLDIIFEDDDLLVVNKPKGMVVHPAVGHQSGTLVHALLHHTDKLTTINGEDRPGIVHRIDRDTSGLLVVAKTDDAYLSLAEQLKKREVKRSYLALVHGAIPHEYGTIEAPIGRNPKDRQSMAVVSGGKEAVTYFEVVERINQKFTIVKCSLKTGRTHQIRVHMKYIEFPIVGDPKYGRKKTIQADGQALHAYEIGFNHPRTNEWMHFEIEPPKSFDDYVEKARESY